MKNVWKFTSLILELNFRLILINRDDLRGVDGHASDFFYGQLQRNGNLLERRGEIVLIDHVFHVGDVITSENDSLCVAKI